MAFKRVIIRRVGPLSWLLEVREIMRINKLFLVLFGSMSLVLSSAFATEPPQAVAPINVTGEWALCQDPDGSAKDVLQFLPEGYGFVVRPDNSKIPFLYMVNDTQVLLIANRKGALVNITLGHDTGFTKLTAKSDKTGNESFYVRASEVSSHACTAQ